MSMLIGIAATLVVAVLLFPLAALTVGRPLSRVIPSKYSYGVKSGVRLFEGAYTGRNPAGYAKPFEPGDEFIGLNSAEIDARNDSADGTQDCEVYGAGEVFELTLTGVTDDDVGKAVYATDDATLSLAGHPDGFVGRIVQYVTTNRCLVRVRTPGETPRESDTGSYELVEEGIKAFAATGATAGTTNLASGFTVESALGLGVFQTTGEDGGITGQFDAVAEIALATLFSPGVFPVDKGITFEARLVVANSGDNAALDVDWGLGTLLTANSKASIDHGDMVHLARFHLDGASDNILAQSDDNVTDVAPVNTGITNDSATDVPKTFKIIVRPSGAVEFWINGARVLSSTTFAVGAAAALCAFVNAEKTSDDTVAVVLIDRVRVAGARA